MKLYAIKSKRSYVYTDHYGEFEKSGKLNRLCFYLDEAYAQQIGEMFVKYKYIEDFKVIVVGEITI